MKLAIRLSVALLGLFIWAEIVPCRAETRGPGVITVSEYKVPLVVVLPGKIEAEGMVDIQARYPGKVKKILVEEGQKVVLGQELILMDDGELMARLKAVREEQQSLKKQAEALEAELLYTEANYKRIKELELANAATRDELERALSSVNGLRAKKEAILASIRAAGHREDEISSTLPYLTVKAPDAGVVVQKYVKGSSFVNPGAPLLRLEIPSQGYSLVADMPEEYLGKVLEGMEAFVALPQRGFLLPGKISNVIRHIDEKSRTFRVKVAMKGELCSGEFGRLMIPVGERQAILIPEMALQRRGGIDGVMVSTEGGYLFRAVRTGGRFLRQEERLLPAEGSATEKLKGSWVEVHSGLVVGERVQLLEEKGQ